MRSTWMGILICVLALGMIATGAEAKWWIFGKSGDDVAVDYLYLNDNSFEEKDTKITLYKDNLPNGMILVRGKARAGKNQIGAVQISTDGKEKWEKARLNDNGTFEYSFKPDTGAVYNLYVKIIDTTGKSNNVDLTHKEVSISDQDVMAAVREALDAMVRAYCQEDARGFMSYVSQDFVGDDTVLDRAIRKDFTLFDNIDLRYTISSIASGGGGKIYVSIFYNRLVISTKNGNTYSDKGTTEFAFTVGDKGPKVYNMKKPLIFGLSDADEVAGGSVVIGTNDQVIQVGPGGDVFVGPITGGGGGGGAADAVQIVEPITGTKHHFINLHFNFTGTFDPTCDLLVDEATSPVGPWDNVYTGSKVDSIMSFTTTRIAGYAGTLYYRARLACGPDFTDWSEVAEWDNN